jgi:hypothetical protein
MEQSPPSKIIATQLGQRIPRLVWIPKVHNQGHNSPPLCWPSFIQSTPSHFFSLRTILMLSSHIINLPSFKCLQGYTEVIKTYTMSCHK